MKDVASFQRRREPGKAFAFTPLITPVEEHFARKLEEYTAGVPKCERCGTPSVNLEPDGERVQPGAGVLLFVRRWRCPRCLNPAVCALEMTAELHEFLEGVIQ